MKSRRRLSEVDEPPKSLCCRIEFGPEASARIRDGRGTSRTAPNAPLDSIASNPNLNRGRNLPAS